MILKRKHLVLGALVLALGAAVYLNWQFSSTGNTLDVSGVVDTNKNLGDSQYVNGAQSGEPEDTAQVSASGNQYFVQARLNRQQARDAALAILKEAVDNSKATEASKKEAVDGQAKIAKNVETEANLENLIKAKGFTECMVTLENDSAVVTVATAGLNASEVITIKDLVVTTAKIPVESVRIIEVK